MNTATFWDLIASSLEEAEGDLDEQMEFLGESLEELDPAEIVDFDRIFLEHWVKAYTWDLWAAAYILGKGCSDDEFVDFLGWLICRGQKVYEMAVKNPDSLTPLPLDVERCVEGEGSVVEVGEHVPGEEISFLDVGIAREDERFDAHGFVPTQLGKDLVGVSDDGRAAP